MTPMWKVVQTKKPSLKAAQGFVDGYVELINLPSGDQVLVNEEGRLKDLAPNLQASITCGFAIVGHAMLLKGKARWL